jgi:hypothetical protein
MTPGNGHEEENNPHLDFTRVVVEKLQDEILQQIETCASEYPDCDPQAFPVAVCQAFVAQCLKTYGEQGFDAARKHTQMIVEAMERAFHEQGDAS